jgi:hypothetical protein
VRRVMSILSLIGALLSFVVCIGVIVLWVRSYSKPLGKSRQEYLSDRQQVRMFGWCPARGIAAFDMYCNRFSRGQVVRLPLPDKSRTELYISGRVILGVRNGWVEQNQIATPPAEHWWERFGIYVRPRRQDFMLPGNAWNAVVRLPYWFLLLLTALGMAPWIFGRLRRSRRREGHCNAATTCGRARSDVRNAEQKIQHSELSSRLAHQRWHREIFWAQPGKHSGGGIAAAFPWPSGNVGAKLLAERKVVPVAIFEAD